MPHLSHMETGLWLEVATEAGEMAPPFPCGLVKLPAFVYTAQPSSTVRQMMIPLASLLHQDYIPPITFRTYKPRIFLLETHDFAQRLSPFLRPSFGYCKVSVKEGNEYINQQKMASIFVLLLMYADLFPPTRSLRTHSSTMGFPLSNKQRCLDS